MAGMLPNKLKNLFNLDFQLNNCCIVMEAIYQNLKDPPLGERPGTMLILAKLWPDLQHFILGLADWAIELRNLHIRLLVWVRDLVIGEYEPFIAIIAQLTIATYKISQAGRWWWWCRSFLSKRHHCNRWELRAEGWPRRVLSRNNPN